MIYTAKLNISNIVLSNNIRFGQEKIIISNTFTNSSILIEELEEIEIKNQNFSETELNVLGQIIYDYYKVNNINNE